MKTLLKIMIGLISSSALAFSLSILFSASDIAAFGLPTSEETAFIEGAMSDIKNAVSAIKSDIPAGDEFNQLDTEDMPEKDITATIPFVETSEATVNNTVAFSTDSTVSQTQPSSYPDEQNTVTQDSVAQTISNNTNGTVSNQSTEESAVSFSQPETNAVQSATASPAENLRQALSEQIKNIQSPEQAQSIESSETIAPTVFETEPITEAVTESESETVSYVYTDIKYSDYNGDKHYYNTLDEAKVSISVSAPSFAECNAAAQSNKVTYKDTVNSLIDMINTYRMSKGLSPLIYDDTLTTIAMHRAYESAKCDWNMTAIENGTAKRHIRPNFQIARSILGEYGLTGNYGENYGRWYASSEDVFNGWVNSSGHNAILLAECFTRIGIGVAPDRDDNLYWIAVFQ